MRAKPNKTVMLRHLCDYLKDRSKAAYPHDDFTAGYNAGHMEGYAQGVCRMLDILEAPDIDGNIAEGAVI